MPQINGETYFTHFLSEAGVTHVFFLPATLFKGLDEMENVGIRAETPDEVSGALKKAFTLDRPVVIDAVSDVNTFARHAWSPSGGNRHGH